MSFLSRLKGLFGVTFGTPGRETWEDAQQWSLGFGLEHQSHRLTDPYSQHNVAARCLGLIARDAASVDWEFFADGDSEEPIEDHPISEVWNKPNLYMHGRQLFIGSYLSKLLFGEWFWYYPDLIVPRRGSSASMQRIAASGVLNRILLLDPRSVKHKVMRDGSVEWGWEVDGQITPLDSKKLTQSKRWNPENNVRGLPLLAATMSEIQADFAAAAWNGRFFSDQNGIPSGLLVPGQGVILSGDQRNELYRQWNQRHGSKRSVAVLPGAGWDFKVIGQSQNDMGFTEMRRYVREEVLAACGVPPLIAGYLDTTIKYNAREQKEIYWQSTINQFVEEEQATLNSDFLPKVGVTDQVFPKWEAVQSMLSDMAEKAATAKIFFDMGVPFAEINERLELGFDPEEIPGSDIGYLPFSLAPAESAGESRTLAGPIGGTNDTSGDATGRGFLVRGNFNEPRRALVWRNIRNSTRDLEEKFDRVVRSHFHEIESEVLANFDGLKGFLAEHSVRKEVSRYIFNVEEAKRKLRKVTAPVYRSTAKRGGDSVAAELGASVSFDVNDPRVLAEIAQLTGRIVRIDDTVERALRSALSEGIEASETVSQLRDRVHDVMGASLGRSRVIARTETGMAFNLSRNMGMQQAGITQHEWLSARDPDVREDHAEEDGNVTHIGEPFQVTHLLYPQDPSGPPEQIINCRCVALPVVGA